MIDTDAGTKLSFYTAIYSNFNIVFQCFLDGKSNLKDKVDEFRTKIGPKKDE